MAVKRSQNGQYCLKALAAVRSSLGECIKSVRGLSDREARREAALDKAARLSMGSHMTI